MFELIMTPLRQTLLTPGLQKITMDFFAITGFLPVDLLAGPPAFPGRLALAGVLRGPRLHNLVQIIAAR